ncbi:MAG: LytTR family DNA-binding domain-containing protein [Leptospirales bacterium]
MPAIEKKHIGNLILLWVAIDFIMSLAWALQISYYYNIPYFQILGPTATSVYCISSLSPLFGTYTGHKLRKRPVVVRFLYIVPASVLGAVLGVYLSEFFNSFLFANVQKQLGSKMQQYTLTTSIIISIIVSILAATIGVLLERNRNFKKRLEQLDITQITKEPKFVTFKNRNTRSKIRIDDIQYLTSTGKRTVLHTSEGDIEIPLLLKNVGIQLPAALFVRVHKKHMVHAGRIGGLRHVHAGAYELTLNDSDDSIIPVGRKYLTEIQALFSQNV